MICPKELRRVASDLRSRAAALSLGGADLLVLAQEYEDQALEIEKKGLDCDPHETVDLPI